MQVLHHQHYRALRAQPVHKSQHLLHSRRHRIARQPGHRPAVRCPFPLQHARDLRPARIRRPLVHPQQTRHHRERKPLAQFVTLPPQHLAPRYLRTRQGLRQQHGLADPGLPLNQKAPATPTRRIPHQPTHQSQFGGPSDQAFKLIPDHARTLANGPRAEATNSTPRVPPNSTTPSTITPTPPNSSSSLPGRAESVPWRALEHRCPPWPQAYEPFPALGRLRCGRVRSGPASARSDEQPDLPGSSRRGGRPRARGREPPALRSGSSCAATAVPPDPRRPA